MQRRRQITTFGWEVKQRLVELKLDQRGFCMKHNIPEARLSELITGRRPVKRYRKIVEEALKKEKKPMGNVTTKNIE